MVQQAALSVRDHLPSSALRAARGSPPVEWRVSDELVDYDAAVAEMERRAAAIAEGRAPELVWLLEHPPLYTAGTSANAADLVQPDRFPVYASGRGGQYTYHGPGQRIAYAMLDLKRRKPDLRAYVAGLESWLIATLDRFGVRGERRDDRVGVWVRRPDRGPTSEDKIAAIGVRVKRWATMHGLALNVEPDLTHYAGIVPCGVRDHGVTSLADLGRVAAMPEVDMALRKAFEEIFGETTAETGRADHSGSTTTAVP